MKRVLLSVALLSTLAFSGEDICSGVYNAGDYQKASDCYINQVKTNNSAYNNYYAGNSLTQQGRYKEALPYMQKAEQLSSDEENLGSIYNNLSVIYSKLRNEELELTYKMKYLNISLKMGDKSKIGRAYNNLGSYYDNMNDNNKALEYYFKALDYYPENEKSTTYNNIAIVYENLYNYDKVNEFYNKSIDISEKTGDYLSLCSSKTNFGIFQYKQEKYLEADKMLSDANTICHNAGKISTEANSLIYLGKSALKQNNLQSAKSYYDRAKPLANKSGNSIILGNLKSLEDKLILLTNK